VNHVTRLSLIADDLGRLRRMGVEGHVLERLCDTVDWMDGSLRPTAADRVGVGVPVLVALAIVDRERAELEFRMGRKRR